MASKETPGDYAVPRIVIQAEGTSYGPVGETSERRSTGMYLNTDGDVAIMDSVGKSVPIDVPEFFDYGDTESRSQVKLTKLNSGAIMVLGPAGKGKTQMLYGFAQKARAHHIQIGEPDSEKQAHPAALPKELALVPDSNRIVVIDSLRYYAVVGVLLAKGGVPRELALIATALDAFGRATKRVVLCAVNVMSSSLETVDDVVQLLDGSCRGLIQVTGTEMMPGNRLRTTGRFSLRPRLRRGVPLRTESYEPMPE